MMLPKSKAARVPSDFRTIASVRLLYKAFAYLVLGRIEEKLEAAQPEEQHGFRSERRIEEHLLTASLVISKTMAANTPLWIISLDLSKAFDRVSWPSLWKALREQGISEQLIWVLQVLYFQQEGKILGEGTESRWFKISAGVRQGCVLSPRLFCCVLQWALRKWRENSNNTGLDLGDGLQNLLDLRYADDILLFGTSANEVCQNLDQLVKGLAEVGLILNSSKTVALTTEAQAPCVIRTPSNVEIRVIERLSSHKWLGCMLSTPYSGAHGLDVDFHLQAASKAFYANRFLLTDRRTSICARLKYFMTVISPVACFAAGHRIHYQDDLQRMGTHFRKLARQVVGPPPGVDRSGP